MSSPSVRVLLDAPGAGPWNMAVDEALLMSAVEREECTVRVYRWIEPTVSLGYFQPEDDPQLAERFSSLARVRRLSGGGAILHHHELTYSCAVPSSHPAAREPARLYESVHGQILLLLAAHGIRARLRGAAVSEPKPFLCFGRGDSRDVVIGRHKIIGSAQRRRCGAILQHGSLLLRRSPYADEFPGLIELCGVAIDQERLAGGLAETIARLLGRAVVGGLSEQEHARAELWEAQRYSIGTTV